MKIISISNGEVLLTDAFPQLRQHVDRLMQILKVKNKNIRKNVKYNLSYFPTVSDTLIASDTPYLEFRV